MSAIGGSQWRWCSRSWRSCATSSARPIASVSIVAEGRRSRAAWLISSSACSGQRGSAKQCVGLYACARTRSPPSASATWRIACRACPTGRFATASTSSLARLRAQLGTPKEAITEFETLLRERKFASRRRRATGWVCALLRAKGICAVGSRSLNCCAGRRSAWRWRRIRRRDQGRQRRPRGRGHLIVKPQRFRCRGRWPAAMLRPRSRSAAIG